MKRYALCIGNDEYQILSKLSCAVADAKAIAEKLECLGFDVDTALNLERDELNSKIVSLSDKVNEYDAVLLYYAGHGFQVEGENLLVPVDFNDKEEFKTAKYRAYPIDDLMRLLGTQVSKTKIIILDACRSTLGIRGRGNNFSPMVAPQGSIIAFSTSPNQTAKEDNKHGLYTKALLQYMDMPRVSIETVFKRVRTELARETKGNQIPWEHTSLIGDFYLNPNTIYDGTNYFSDAYSDEKFVYKRGNLIGKIVDLLKTYTWQTQRAGMRKMSSIDFESAQPEELFVLGRNIYQAACGNCFDCQRFIDNFTSYAYIPDKGKEHLLNGMAFEIYYDHEGRKRKHFKTGYAVEVIKLLESEEFFGSREFIASRLENEDGVIFYIPGQNSKVRVNVNIREIEKGVVVDDIIYEGVSYYYNVYNNSKPIATDFNAEMTKSSFEADLRKKMVVMTGYLDVTYKGANMDMRKKLLVPFNGYSLFPREEDI